ncbi:hypothetical protein Q2317_25530, partial [Escherichia coli]|nr:hypothetical protein [Escherichia coli]
KGSVSHRYSSWRHGAGAAAKAIPVRVPSRAPANSRFAKQNGANLNIPVEALAQKIEQRATRRFVSTASDMPFQIDPSAERGFRPIVFDPLSWLPSGMRCFP